MSDDLQLGYQLRSKLHYQPLRPLTDEEKEKHSVFTPIFKEAENRLQLFKILRLNYEAWKSFTESLLQVRSPVEEPMLIANQLLFNFLATAYAITEHFKVSFRRRFKKDPLRLREYRDFLDRLCAAEWAVAFFFDFRNYVQHNALPVGRCNTNVSHKQVSLKITQDAAALLADYSDWKRSKLNLSHGEIDLIELAHDYYIRIKQDYGKFVAKTFYPELVDMQTFYTALTNEASNGDPDRRMVFFEKLKVEESNGSVSGSMTVCYVANDPLAELGIVVGPSGV